MTAGHRGGSARITTGKSRSIRRVLASSNSMHGNVVIDMLLELSDIVRLHYADQNSGLLKRSSFGPAGLPSRVEAKEDVVVTTIRSDTLEVRPPPMKEGEQHVTPGDSFFTERNSSFVFTKCCRAHGQHER